jgi:hypothetical protein
MQLRPDWVSMAIFGVGFALFYVRAIPVKIRHLIQALCFGAIVAYRLQANLQPMLFTGLAGIFGVISLFRALTANDRPRVQRGDDD